MRLGSAQSGAGILPIPPSGEDTQQWRFPLSGSCRGRLPSAALPRELFRNSTVPAEYVFCREKFMFLKREQFRPELCVQFWKHCWQLATPGAIGTVARQRPASGGG